MDFARPRLAASLHRTSLGCASLRAAAARRLASLGGLRSPSARCAPPLRGGLRVESRTVDERSGRLARLRLPGWLALVLLALLWLHFFRSLPATYSITLMDFPAYRSAGRHIAEGEPERLYRTDKDFTNLPIVAALLVPLWHLSYPTAWKLFWWLAVASYVATFAVVLLAIRRHLPPLTPARALLAGAILLCFAPVLRRCLVLGQTTPMLVLLLACAYAAMRAGRPRLAGVLLGFVCLWKIPPVLLIAVFAARRRLALALAALAVPAAGVALSLALYGGGVLSDYVDVVILDNLGRSVAAFNNRSLEGVFMRLWTDESLVDWTPTRRPTAVTVSVLAAIALLAAGLLALSRPLLWPARAPCDGDPRSGSLELELCVGCALMLLVFPIVWGHYYLFLVVPLCVLPAWCRARGLPTPAWWIALLAAAIWLCAGGEIAGNAYYAEREGDRLFRLSLARQTLGAVLLLAASALPLGELARRARARPLEAPAGGGRAELSGG
jgi:hypothetical protein